MEKFEKDKLREEPLTMLKDIAKIAADIAEIEPRTGKQQPDVIT